MLNLTKRMNALNKLVRWIRNKINKMIVTRVNKCTKIIVMGLN